MSKTPSLSNLRSRAAKVMTADRRSLQRRLGGVQKLTAERRRSALVRITADLAAAEARIAARRAATPEKIAYPPELPITAWRSELKDTITTNQVIIVAGETGSGKSTQLPKLCLELGRGIDGLIGHTQPRRIAARSIAERVAEELRTTVGATVGYTVRFTDEVGERTLIKVMTDGILLNELQRDRMLSRYDTIIIDEAHERSLNIDFLLGYLKQLLPKRPDLKVIITSATIDTERFSEHFDNAPIIEVSGRTYPVEIRYRPLVDPDGGEPKDQTDGIVEAVTELCAEGSGDILVFCSGEREIRDAAEALRNLELRHTEVLPLFGRLSSGEQHRVFAAHTGRRVVVATNVAETSLTVPGVRYVVDAGTARISRFSRRTKVQRLPIEAVSQASADQRAGRCGRLGPGVCIRLYALDDYLGRPEFTDPEILRTNLASVILQMAAIGLGDISDFPFLEPPETRTIRDGIALLEELGAVEGSTVGRREWLTDAGTKLARIPLDPRMGRMLLAAHGEACLREVLIIAAALSIIDPRERPTGKEEQAAQMHRRFKDDSSDFLGILSLWEYIEKERRARTSNQFRRMCRDEFLNWRRVREWQDIHAQLRRVVDDLGLTSNRQPATPELIHRALLAGLLSHIGMKDPDSFEYRGARSARFAINPGSSLFKKAPPWIMAAELVETTRLWGRVIAGIEPAMVEELGEHLVNRTRSDPWWDADKGAVVAHETVSIYGVPLATNRIVMFHRFDVSGARAVFIRHALVLGEWSTHHGFVERNAAMIEEVEALEARGRRADMMVDEDALVRFFDGRIPDDIVSTRHFDRWWNQIVGDQPHLLDYTVDDLVAVDAVDVDDALYPPVWHWGDADLDLSYEFDPSSENDGVTIEIPIQLLDRVDPGVLEWNVPGFRNDLIAALIKSLPKRQRKLFAPVPDTAKSIAGLIGPEEGTLTEALRRELSRRSGVVVLPDDFNRQVVPRHLLPRFRIVGQAGDVVAEGDNLEDLREMLRVEARAMVSSASHPLERDNIVEWDFGDLPDQVTLQGDGRPVVAYPALVDGGDRVSIRLLANRQEQTETSWIGLRRLLLLSLPNPARLLGAVLTNDVRLALVSSPYSGSDEWMADCLACALDEVIAGAGGLVWTASGFDRLLTTVRDDLAEALEQVGGRSAAILSAIHEVTQLLARTTGSRLTDAAEDVRAQLGQFVYPGFLAGVGADRLGDVHRYVRAAAYRLSKLPENPDRDYAHMVLVRSLEDELDALIEALPWTHQMLDVTWMLQELRVSLFAQPVGAKGSVSEKRVRRALAELLEG
ncbi:MAG: ATP-dependent RNA helicase HrpA [bacterium]|nr:ATP-dependent RNA helicase HrpA [bacterium]